MAVICIDSKVVIITEALYNDTECAVVIDGHLTEWFSLNVGLRQGSLLSLMLFNVFIEFVTKELQDINEPVPTMHYADSYTISGRYYPHSVIFEKLYLDMNIT